MFSQIVYNFEAAHQKGDVPRVQDFVPSDVTDRTILLRELVLIDLEYRRKRGLPIRVDAYLTPFPELSHNEDLLLELLEAEYRERQGRGEPITWEAFAQRFPHLERRLAAGLSESTMDPNRTDPDLPLGWVGLPEVPGYLVLSVLGEGGMGIVYQARHLALDRIVALKMIKGGTMISAPDLQRFRTEAEAVARLQHPNIVQIHEVGQCQGLPYFTLEYCAGGSLAKKLDGTPLPPQEAARLAETLARAMAVAHQKQLIHRDLKPHNLLLTEDGVIKISDFGLAKKLDTGGQQTQSGAVVGTPSYMAPEQARGDLKAVGPLADVYALGAILYEMLTGRPPFKGATAMETVLQVLNEDPVSPRRLQPRTPRDLEAICLRCLHKEPGKRYASAQAVAEDLRRFSNGEVILARPAGRLEQAWRWCRRYPARAGLTAAVVALVLGASATAWWYQEERVRQDTESRLRGGTLNREVGSALTEAERLLDRLHQQLDDPQQVQELLSDLGQWRGQLDSVVAIRKRAQALAAGDERLLEADAMARLGRLQECLDRDQQAFELALALDQVRLEAYTLVEGKFDFQAATKKYPEVFARADLDVTQVDPKAVAARIKASPARYALVAALDHWAGVHVEVKLMERLLAIARQADPDPWRDRFRNVEVWFDLPALEKLTAEVKVQEQSPQVLVALAAQLKVTGGKPAQVLRQAVRDHPRDFWLFFVLGNYATAPVERVGWYHAALAIRPRDAAAHNGLGGALYEQQDLPGAIAEYRKAIALAPNYAQAYTNLGLALRHQHDLPGAIAQYRKAIEREPNYAHAYHSLGVALQEQKDLPGAIAQYRKAIALNPKMAQAYHSLGLALQEQKDVHGGRAMFLKTIELDPNHATAYYNIGKVLHEQKDVQGAMAQYRKAIAIDPNLALAYGGLGKALYDQKDLPGAIAQFRKAIELDPKFAAAYNGLGVALLDQKDMAGAIAQYRKAIALDPNFAPAYYYFGRALHVQKDLKGAILQFRKAIEVDPNYAPAYTDLGIALLDQKDPQGAIVQLRKAIELDPNHAPAYHNLGNALQDQKDLKGAIAQFRKAIELDPKLAVAFAALGAALLEQQDFPGAVTQFRKAIELDPNFVVAYHNLGLALVAQKDLAGAIAQFRKAVALNPNLPQTFAALGWALQQQGQFSEALQANRQLVKLLPPGHPWQKQVQRQIQHCERFLAVERQLEVYLDNKETPKQPQELLAMIQLCRLYKQYHGTAAHLYAAAFAVQPALAEHSDQDHRYLAARSAVLAAAGQGRDPVPPTAQEKTKLRALALAWLQADLQRWAKQFQDRDPKALPGLSSKLPAWPQDAAMAVVRNAQERAKLPGDEQPAWQQLWADVDQLLKQVATKVRTLSFKGALTAKERERVQEVKLQKGQVYLIDLESTQFDAYLRLHDGQGKLLAENDDIEPGINLNARLIFTAPADGTFRLVATSFEQRGTGAYNLTVRSYLEKK